MRLFFKNFFRDSLVAEGEAEGEVVVEAGVGEEEEVKNKWIL